MAAQAFTSVAGNPGSNQPTGYAAADGFVGAPATPFNPNSPTFNPASFPSGAHGVSMTATLSLPVTATANTDYTYSLPTGAITTSQQVITTTAYTAGTDAKIQIGASAGDNAYVAATSIKAAGVAPLTAATGSAAAYASAPNASPNFFVRVVQSGTATAVGAATLVVNYTLP